MTSLPESGGRLARAFERWNLRYASMGALGLGALLLALVTGVLLVLGYDVTAPLQSLGLLQLSSLSGRLSRSVHAWSGHLLVLLTLVHVVDHLARGTDERPTYALWLRLTLSVPLLFGVMLTGFILRGDGEGALARQIVGGLLERLPWVGAALSTSLLGAGEELQLVYVHHVATFTVLLLVIVIEHGRRIWPPPGGVLAVLGLALVLGWLWPPALHNGIDPELKGPWYFVGFQEVLHWLTRPGGLWLVILAPMALLVALPRLQPVWRRRGLWSLAIVLVVYACIGLWAQFFRGPGWVVQPPWAADTTPSRAATVWVAPAPLPSLDAEAVPTIGGRPEGCVVCHGQVQGLRPSHEPQALGCFSCHLGDPFAADAADAHAGMVRVPGNLDTAPLTCGQGGCHDQLVRRVRGSLMATVRGMVAVDRWAFGEQETPDGMTPAAQLGDSPADTHLRQMCISCHLGRLKNEPAPVTEASRGGGCVACHLSYPKERDYNADNVERFTHPALSVAVSDESCFGCHSRSGRISLSYAGWWETHLTPDEAVALPQGETRTLEDGRILRRATADIHHSKGMACIDCHTAAEAMGDGVLHLHEEQATRVRCETCHLVAPARTVEHSALDLVSRATVRLRFGDSPPQRFLLEERTGEPLTNAWPLADGNVEMRGKLSGKRHLATPPAAACRELEGHARLSCRACHATWVTTCVACHTQWDATGERYDVLTGEQEQGAWVEYDGAPAIGPPPLGLLQRHGEARIEPFAPGMIMTVNGPHDTAPTPLPDAAKTLVRRDSRFLRAFALAVPHTTTRAGRGCASCHSDPVALGYGKGELQLVPDGNLWRWRFESAYEASAFDGLPGDAWIGFLTEARAGVSTRRETGPLGLEAQRKTLRVGACLGCHDPSGTAGRALYADFAASLRRLSPACRVPLD